MLGAQPAQHLRPLQARQHPVQDHGVIGMAVGQVQAGDPVRGHIQHVPPRFEVLEQVGDQLAVVFYDQEPHGRLS
ncbi:hypothetical protein D3C72_1558900 [compost metagenome]